MKRIEFKYHPNLYNDEITDFGTRGKPFSWQEDSNREETLLKVKRLTNR